jgi:DMSO/TMAO reductase YedYZ molybdopterin-dependent catalytic subunit
VPPGQYVTTDFPVLSAGPTPDLKVANWTLALQAEGSLVGNWDWAQFEALPQTTLKTDIHCVTKWSKLDTTWRGVTFDDLLKAAGLDARSSHAARALARHGGRTLAEIH